ncbi:MAG: hypothetical protein IH589_07935 [Anaerolineales bacterium]|nr:hypothetical protein [Anaerolineales bacterium]
MELKQYFEILWRRKWVILLTFFVTITTVIVGTNLITPVYQTSAILRIATSASGQLNYSEYTYAERLMNTYAEVATSRPVLDELMVRLKLKELPNITAEVIPNTELIKITVEDEIPQLAANVANTLAEILYSQGNQLYSGSDVNSAEVLGEQVSQVQADLDKWRKEYGKLIVQTPAYPERISTTDQMIQMEQQIYIRLLDQYEQAVLRETLRANMVTVIETAVVPQKPSEPRVALNYALGSVIGLIGGLGLAFLFENLGGTRELNPLGEKSISKKTELKES